MAIWFRYGSCAVGVENAVVRAADYARFVTLEDAVAAVGADRDAALAQGRVEVESLRAAAQTEADALIAAAREQRDAAYREGYERGMEDGAVQWTQVALASADEERLALSRQSERLGNIVSMAVEQMVVEENRGAIFQRALQTITRIVKDVPLLTLRVPEGDQGSAQDAVNAVLAHVEGRTSIEVVADGTLAPGSCLFVSDRGTIDAGLQTQLAAIRRAVARTSNHPEDAVDERTGSPPTAPEAFDASDASDDESSLRTDAYRDDDTADSMQEDFDDT